MISSKKTVFMTVLIMAGVFVPILAAEPNEPNEPNFPKTVIKFENADNRLTLQWWVRSTNGQPVTPSSSIKPAYIAQIRLSGYPAQLREETYVMATIFESPISKKFSKEQQEFLKTGFAIGINVAVNQTLPGYIFISLYATSSEDAKLMAEALIDTLNTRAEKEFTSLKKKINKDKQELDKAQKELPEIEKQLEGAEKQYKRAKDATHQYSSDTEAADIAKKSMIEMDKQLNLLDIELAGIREKLKNIEKYNNKYSPGSDSYRKLDEMYVELMVELSGLQARRDMTEKIRHREQEFLKLFVIMVDLKDETNRLRSEVRDHPNVILNFSNRLKDTTPRSDASWLPPNVYQDTVLIYPVENR